MPEILDSLALCKSSAAPVDGMQSERYQECHHNRDSIAALKTSASIVDIASRHTTLTPRAGEFWDCCPFHQEKSPSFKISPARQRWHCFGGCGGGDVLDFVAKIEGLDNVGAIKRLRELVGAPAAPRLLRSVPIQASPDPRVERNRERAQTIWGEAETIPASGIALDYLTERRGLSMWDPDRLRWHPECPWQDGTAGCIVAPVNDSATGLVAGVWRILPVMQGEVERRGLGPMQGNASRLFHPDEHRLVITEGVEDAVAARELTGWPAWAALSAGNMGALVLPARIRDVLILADRDENGVGLAKARVLAGRLCEEGRTAAVKLPTTGKDANDVLRLGRAA